MKTLHFYSSIEAKEAQSQWKNGWKKKMQSYLTENYKEDMFLWKSENFAMNN